jgi:hypothetical protein
MAIMESEMPSRRSHDTLLSRRELLPVFLAGAASMNAGSSEPRPLTLRASGGVSVYAWHYPAAGKALPAILLFHQAGSNHAEYATIAPRLAALGYHSVAIDQRSGGRMWSQSNRTAAELGKEVDYPAALPDLEAALEWPPSRVFLRGRSSGEAAIRPPLYSCWRRNIRQPWRPSWHFLQASILVITIP